jgi:hypothetical protein
MASSAHHGGQNREEAAMAKITFNAADRNELARQQLKAALAAYGEMLDTFVNSRVPQAAAEAGQAPTRLIPGAPSKSKNTP